MPHKHTRREKDLALFDLPPTRIARPLPTAPAPKKKGHNKTSTTKTRAKDVPKDAKAVTTTATASSKAVSKPEVAATTTTASETNAAAASTAAAPPPPTETKSAKAKNADPRNLKRKREAAKAANKGSVAAAPALALSKDTPRAFRRLMALANGKRTRSGLDNGDVKETKRQKKERRAQELAAASAAAAAEAGVEGDELKALEATKVEEGKKSEEGEKLTIRPGEKLADFNRRVDAALPLAGLAKNALPNSGGGKDPLGLAKTFRTKQERKLHKLYDQWRAEEAKIQARREEAQEEAEENEAELDEEFGVKWRVDFASSKRSRKSKGGSGNNYGGDDIWADFNRKRAKADKADAVRAGVHNSVEAPPERLTRIDTSKFNFVAKQKQKEGKGKGVVAAAAAAAAARTVR